MKQLLITTILLLISISAHADDKVMVQVVFTEETEVGQYRDALYFTPEQYKNMDEKTLEAKKKERIDNFVNAVKNPPEPVSDDAEVIE